jgi:DNA topoisomerase I
MLIIVESPAKAKTISHYLGKNHIVKASVGHVRQISDDKKTLDGRKLLINGIDIENGFTPIYEIDEKKQQVVKDLKELAKSAKDGILFATDSDREGEAISWHLAEVLGIKDKTKVKRLEFHEITKSAIEKAMKNPRDLNIKLVTAQQARQVLDKLVGYSLSPVLWSVVGNYKLSAGRVQSPALRLVCEREKEIEDFLPKEYWEISGNLAISPTPLTQTWNLFDKNKKNLETKIKPENESEEETVVDFKNLKNLRLIRVKGQKIPTTIDTKAQVELLIKDLDKDTEFTVNDIKITPESIHTKPPFITSTLQQAASSKLGFTPKITMQLAQKLYEGVEINGQPMALITYMRTDSYNLSTESISLIRDFIQNNFPQFLPQKSKVYKSKSKNAQEAHEAIRVINPNILPKTVKLALGKLDTKLFKLYDLIWRQTIACQMTDELRERFGFELENSQKDAFAGSVVTTTSQGFKAVLEGDF